MQGRIWSSTLYALSEFSVGVQWYCGRGRGDTLTCSLVFEEDLQLATDADIKGSIARLEAHKATDAAGMFKMRERAIGFAYQEHGLLFDESLRNIIHPVSQYLHDWCHCMFAGGVFNICCYWFMVAINAAVTHNNGWGPWVSMVPSGFGRSMWKSEPPRVTSSVLRVASLTSSRNSSNVPLAKAYPCSRSLRCSRRKSQGEPQTYASQLAMQ